MVKRWVGILGLVFLFSQLSLANPNSGCPFQYIPAHDDASLMELRRYAIGSAFGFFADKAGYRFDGAAYEAAVPNRELMNFGMVTGTACLGVDIMSGYFNAMNHLAVVYRKFLEQPEEMEMTFREAYLRIAESYGFDQYLEPAGTDI